MAVRLDSLGQEPERKVFRLSDIPQDTPEAVRQPQGLTEPTIDKPVTDRPLPNMGFGPSYPAMDVPDVDVMRSLKDYANIGSEFAQSRLSGKRWANKAAISYNFV